MKEELRQHEKRLVIHDLPAGAMPAVKDENIIEICDDGSIKSCIGCFGCWLKTPGKCILKDKYNEMGRLLAGSGEIILISRCCFGGPGPFVKNVLDRSIPYILPYFVIKKRGNASSSEISENVGIKSCFLRRRSYGAGERNRTGMGGCNGR